MKTITRIYVLTVTAAGLLGLQSAIGQEERAGAGETRGFEETISDWHEQSREAANQVRERYGEPEELTSRRAIWHDEGVWTRIMVESEPIEHNFPEEHLDVVYHTVEYNVPKEKAGDLIEMSGSLIIDRVRGEVTSRCADEEANILTLNLAHQIIEGLKNPKSARDTYAQVILEDEHQDMIERLFFSPPQQAGADPDVVYGAPDREARETEDEPDQDR